MAIAMTVGATKIQILQQNCFDAVDEVKPQTEGTLSAEAAPEGQACAP